VNRRPSGSAGRRRPSPDRSARIGYSDRLALLLSMVNELSKSRSFDGLCRRAVEIVKERFHFDRAGIVFFDGDGRFLLGSYGTDEKGRLRDERRRRGAVLDPHAAGMRKGTVRLKVFRNDVLTDGWGKKVGRADHAIAGLWDGRRVIGLLSADQLLSKRKITADDARILELFAASIGHLCTLKRTENELSETKNRLEYILGVTKTNIDIIDGDFNLRYVDPEWIKLYGEPSGRKCWEYFMGRDSACPTCGIPESLRSRKPTVTEETLPREGNRVIEVHTIPFREPDGQWMVAEFNVDVTARKRAENRMRISMQEKEVLLKEIHHRVKNNLQMIVSLLNLQAGKVADPKTLDTLDVIRRRIYSIALLHEKLYGSSDLSGLRFDEYIRTLVHDLPSANAAGSPIRISLHLEPVIIDFQSAVPSGLILNEAVTNAVKHAFTGRPVGRIEITMKNGADGSVRLGVFDDGVGLPAGFDPRMTDSLGFKIILTLLEQVGGNLRIENRRGTRLHIRLPSECRVRPVSSG
jgi:two-component sensor histidine kinase